MDKNAKIFIAWHGWLVGSAIVRKFRSEGYGNLILRTRSELDLRNSSEVESFFVENRPDYVVLSAAKVWGVASHANHHFDMLHENLLIQNSVINTAYRNGVSRLLFIASGTIYPTECPQPINESSLLQWPFDSLHESYGLAKVCWLKLCEKARLESGRDFFTLVPTNMYGVGDTFEEWRSSVMASLVKRFHLAKIQSAPQVQVWWTWNALREFLYVDDMADAVFHFLLNPPPSPFVNIWSDQELSVRELAQHIRQVVWYEWDVVFDTTKPEGRLRRKLDTGLAESFGWRWNVGISEGIERLYDYYLKISVDVR